MQTQDSSIFYQGDSRDQLRVLFWNARSLNKHEEELIPILKNIDIFICVESWLKKDISVEFAGFNCFRKDRNHSRGGGILILLQKNISFSEVINLDIPDECVEIAGLKITNINLLQNSWVQSLARYMESGCQFVCR